MARLYVDGPDLVVGLTLLEKLGGFVGEVRVPLSSVTAVRTAERPYQELRGMRVGTGIPWVIVLGRMVHRGGKDFVAVYGTGPTAVVELDAGQRFQRLLVSGVPTAQIEGIRAAVAAAKGAPAQGPVTSPA